MAVHEPMIATYESSSDVSVLRFTDLESGRVIVAGDPGRGRWSQLFGSFSPDGHTFAIGVETGRGVGAPGGLALIDVATGAVRLVAGQPKIWISTPVWSADSAWMVFNGTRCRA